MQIEGDANMLKYIWKMFYLTPADRWFVGVMYPFFFTAICFSGFFHLNLWQWVLTFVGGLLIAVLIKSLDSRLSSWGVAKIHALFRKV